RPNWPIVRMSSPGPSSKRFPTRTLLCGRSKSGFLRACCPNRSFASSRRSRRLISALRWVAVAREAAALVLLDDDFASIVVAIRLGRRIYDNIRKAIAFTFAVHVPIAGLSILPVFFGDWPLLLLPTHIVFLELIIDPSCSLVFEAEEAEANVMKRPPSSQKDRLFSLHTVGLAVLQGLSVLAVCVGVFLFSHRNHAP